MAKAKKALAAKPTTPKKKPTTAKKLSTRAIDPQMKAGFKRNDNGNRPIFLYLTGAGITSGSSVTIASVEFTPAGGTADKYALVGPPTVRTGYIRLRVKADTMTKCLTAPPGSGQFTVLVTVDGGQQEKACLDAILYDE